MPDTDDGGKVVTLRWPKCIQPHKLTSFGLPRDLVYIGSTSTGIESRQRISDIGRGAYLNLDFMWISENDDEIEEFYAFFNLVGGNWSVFLLSDGIKCLIPGYTHYEKYLPSPYWRIDLPDNLEGFDIKPSGSGCCMIDFSLKLVNILTPPDRSTDTVDYATMSSAVKDPTAATPTP